MIDEKVCLQLIDSAIKVRDYSYSPYSNFKVGASILVDDFKIFLDLKFHDIPNIMADACEEVSKLGVDMINIHASAGKIAIQEVMTRLSKFSKRPLVLAVSALTSFDEENYFSIYRQILKKL